MLKQALDILLLGLVRTLFLALEVLPDTLARKLARFYVSILFLFMPRLAGVARRNLSVVFPDKAEDEREAILEESKSVLAENLFGFSRIPRLNQEKAELLCEEYEHANAAMEDLYTHKEGLGVLLPTIHFGSFELFIQVHALRHKPVSILARGFGLPRLDRWWNARREMHGNQLFARSGGFKEIVRRLKNGEDVVVLCDQNVKQNHAMFVDFFGHPAATTKAVALAAHRTGARILFGSPLKNGEGTFAVTAEKILHPDEVEGDTEEKLHACMEDLHRAFERQILRRPEGWFWIHRRWKTRPPGEPENFYD